MNHLLGQSASLLAALAWACALVLFKRSGERVSPIALNLFKNAIGIGLLAITLAALFAIDMGRGLPGGEYQPGLVFRLSPYEYAILAVSGIIGIALADTVFFYALNLIGVGLVSIVDCCYSPGVLLFAWLMLGETLSVYHYVGGALILTGILIASGHKPPPGRTRGQILLGMLLAMLAITSMGFGIVLAKPVLQQVPVIWATTVRLVAGTAALIAVVAFLPGGAEHWKVFKPARVWRMAIPAAFLGTYLSLIAWIAGFKYTYASVAAVLNQTSVIFALILATVFLKEPFGTWKFVAGELALTGVAVVTATDSLFSLARWPWITALVLALVILPVLYHLKWGRAVPGRRVIPADGYCLGCGYPVLGLPGPRCPECGVPFDVIAEAKLDHP
jgi:drug/metabolite transporter (DMT)-like permease